RYYGAVRLPASLSPRFVAFAWRYQTVRRRFRSRRSRTPDRGPGVRLPVPSAGTVRLETVRVSQVPGEPPLSVRHVLAGDGQRRDAGPHDRFRADPEVDDPAFYFLCIIG